MSSWKFYSDKIYRKPDYWVGDIRRAGGVSLIEAFVRNYGNRRLDAKGKVQIAKSIRMRVQMQGTGTEQFVVVIKEL